MLKILRTVPFFAPAFAYGGPVVHTYNISKIQASLGYNIRVFTTNILTNEIISGELPRYEILDGINVHRFPIRYRINQSHYFITPRLPFGFLKYKYDIIHSHSFRTFQTDISSMFSAIKKKPFVFTAHGTLRDISLFNWFVKKEKEAKRIKFYDSIFKNLFLKVVDKIIVHSEYEKFWTIRNRIPKNLIEVIPHGVNIDHFLDKNYKRRFQDKFKKTEKMILYVGRMLRNYRNLEHLIIVLKDIIKEIPSAKLWLVGHVHDKDYEIELRKLVKKLNLRSNVLFLTHPTRAEVFGAYKCANVVVFPITNSDSFGIPVLEAGAAKAPIISIKRGPALELIQNGKTGILVEKNNLDQLKNAILKVLSDDELRKKLGQNGYQNVKRNYTWDIITKKTNQVYEELI
ncbi:MAG: glycosyltransferase family 4 protein [Candidatus Hodarchaeota archaeon]